MKKKTIDIPLFYGKLHIIQGELEEVEKKYNVVINSYDGATFWDDEKAEICVWIGVKTSGIIAHEALHATNIILRWVGVVADYQNDETQAYLLQYIVDKISKTVFKPLENKK